MADGMILHEERCVSMNKASPVTSVINVKMFVHEAYNNM